MYEWSGDFVSRFERDNFVLEKTNLFERAKEEAELRGRPRGPWEARYAEKFYFVLDHDNPELAGAFRGLDPLTMKMFVYEWLGYFDSEQEKDDFLREKKDLFDRAARDAVNKGGTMQTAAGAVYVAAAVAAPARNESIDLRRGESPSLEDQAPSTAATVGRQPKHRRITQQVESSIPDGQPSDSHDPEPTATSSAEIKFEFLSSAT